MSHKSAWKAEEMGYKNVVVYPLGFQGWEEQGYRTWTKEDLSGADEPGAAQKEEESAEPVEAADVPQGEYPGSIAKDFFKEIVENRPGSVQLIDVRDKEEFQGGHFPTAKRMTVDEIENNMDEFDTSKKPIVLYCSTGSRSGEAYFMFKDLRPKLDVYYLDANVDFEGEEYSIEKN
jgi:rhodanese-related sulfurtransferase